MNYETNIKYLFPKTNKLDQLLTDSEGEYSISKPEDAKLITKLLKKKMVDLNILINESIITDSTAGVGGNTISFCRNFKYVNAIEINKNRFEYLKNNLNIYELLNHKLYNDSMINIIPKVKQDVIFADPPWGGKEYINHNKLDLFIDNIEIIKLSKEYLDNNNCKLIVLKLPFNYNQDNLSIFDEKYNITKYLIRKKILLLLINKK